MRLNLFKRRKHNNSISRQLIEIQKQNPKNLHINIFIRDQILFQVISAKNLKHEGFRTENQDDFIELHFFNKNKTLTSEKQSKFKNSEIGKDYFHFENPEGIHNYIKSIKNNPLEIENRIFYCFKEIYDLTDLTEIKIQYRDY